MFRDGKAVEEIAGLVGLSASAVRSICGVRLRSKRKDTIEYAIKIVGDLMHTKKSYAEIGETHGVTRQMVHSIAGMAISAGITLHPSRWPK